MNNQKVIIESLAMDLKRVALGLHRGSFERAKRFKEEALRRSDELENQKVSSYLNKLITKMKSSLLGNDEKTAEDALMYSTLFQNFAQNNFQS